MSFIVLTSSRIRAFELEQFNKRRAACCLLASNSSPQFNFDENSRSHGANRCGAVWRGFIVMLPLWVNYGPETHIVLARRLPCGQRGLCLRKPMRLLFFATSLAKSPNKEATNNGNQANRRP